MEHRTVQTENRMAAIVLESKTEVRECRDQIQDKGCSRGLRIFYIDFYTFGP